MTASLIDRLRAVVGDAHALVDGDLSAYELDWHQRERGKAMAVVRPATTQQVADVVKVCAAAGTSIVPQGGNTGMVLGSIPDGSGTQVLMNLQRMHAVREIDRANLTVTVEAGCVLQTLQSAAAEAGLLFPLSLAAEGSCTIGGNLATNAGGTQVLRYGNTRDLCLGLEVVTAQGEIWQGLSGLRKDNTGYDLRDLFVGSEGTLGIITAATMKLYPQPVASLTAWAAVPSLDAAVELLGLAHRHLAAGLTGFEVMNPFALSLVVKQFPDQRVPFLADNAQAWGVLLENADSESENHARQRLESLLEAAMAAGCVVDAVVAANLAQGKQLWHVRESIPLAQAKEGRNIKHDISIPVSRIPAFVLETDALLRHAIDGARLVDFGHLGDGNLHYNVQAPEGADAVAFVQQYEAQANDIVYAAVARYEGSISAEHGIGALKLHKLEKSKSPVALGLMRTIKGALDPKGTMNPGRVLRTP